MMGEMNTLPINGRVLIAGLIYASTTVFALGPLVAERSIEKSGWNNRCQSTLRADIAARRSPQQVIPALDCQSLAETPLVGTFMPELGEFCDYYGNPDFGGLTTDLLRAQERTQREIEERRLARAAAQTDSRCECAAAVVAQDSAWALHAGSLRLITPTAVKKLDTELQQALYLPRCAERG